MRTHTAACNNVNKIGWRREKENERAATAAAVTNILYIRTHATLIHVYRGSFCAVLQLFSLALFPFVSTTWISVGFSMWIAKRVPHATHELTYNIRWYVTHTHTHTVRANTLWKESSRNERKTHSGCARHTQVFPHTVGLVSASKGCRLFAKYSYAIHAIVCRIAFSHHSPSSGQVKLFSCEFSKFSTKAQRKITFDRIFKCIHELNR